MPLVRILGAFALVWFYHGLTEGLVSGLLRLVVVVALAFLTWVVVLRSFSPLLED